MNPRSYRVLITAAEVGQFHSGMGVYAYEMARRLAPLLRGRGIDLTIALREDAQALRQDKGLVGIRILPLRSSQGNKLRKVFDFYRAVGAVAGEYDLVYSLDHKVPRSAYRAKNTVVTITDCCYADVKGEHGVLRNLFFNHIHAESCRRATKVVTISHTAKASLKRHFSVPDDRVLVAYCGFPDTHDRKSSVDITSKYGLPDRFFLTLGHQTPRKNLILTAKAIALLRARQVNDLKIALVGPKGWRKRATWDFIREHGIENSFIDVGYVPASDLPMLFRSAAALLYPSLCEGFGMPVLEALARGCQVVVARGDIGTEVGYPYAIEVDPYDPAEMADVLVRLRDSAYPPVPDVTDHLAKFSWDDSAIKVADMLCALLEHNQGTIEARSAE